jgi:hypothetical protein
MGETTQAPFVVQPTGSDHIVRLRVGESEAELVRELAESGYAQVGDVSADVVTPADKSVALQLRSMAATAYATHRLGDTTTGYVLFSQNGFVEVSCVGGRITGWSFRDDLHALLLDHERRSPVDADCR